MNNLDADARYVEFVPGMHSEIVVPLLHKSRPIGALNILSRSYDAFGASDVSIVRQFGAHVAVALVNARLYERSRLDADAFETLAEIGRDVASILDVNELLTRIAQLTKRLIEYRTFGLFLLNADHELEIKVAVKYGEQVEIPRIGLGEGLVGYAALHKEAVLVPDVSQDPRYIKVVDDVCSELAMPLMLKDRCIGVIDLESPVIDAFSKRDVEILTLLAGAGSGRDRERQSLRGAAQEPGAAREGSPLRAARADGAAARRTAEAAEGRRCRRRVFAGARARRRLPRLPVARVATRCVVTLGDVSGKGVPAALYSAFAAELVRGRTFRRRYLPDRSSPAGILSSVNTILHQRQLEEYYCTLVYAVFDLKRRILHDGELGAAVPGALVGRRLRADRAAGCAARVVPGHHL